MFNFSFFLFFLEKIEDPICITDLSVDKWTIFCNFKKKFVCEIILNFYILSILSHCLNLTVLWVSILFVSEQPSNLWAQRHLLTAILFKFHLTECVCLCASSQWRKKLRILVDDTNAAWIKHDACHAICIHRYAESSLTTKWNRKIYDRTRNYVICFQSNLLLNMHSSIDRKLLHHNFFQKKTIFSAFKIIVIKISFVLQILNSFCLLFHCLPFRFSEFFSLKIRRDSFTRSVRPNVDSLYCHLE